MSAHPGEPTGAGSTGANAAAKPGSTGRHVEIPDETLSPAMEELATALADIVPDPAVRLSVVHQCFHPDRSDAPYPLALQALTGTPVPPTIARDAWALTMQIQQHWSDRVGEVVSLRSAAMEALDRCNRTMQTRTSTSNPGLNTAPGRAAGGSDDASRTGSLREYLDRDLQTGLYLRPAYEAALREGIKKASPEEPLSLLLFAVDGLASLPQETAEDLSTRAAEVLRHHCRRADIPCRYSPDHFAVLMPAASSARAQERAEKLLQALRPIVESFSLTAFGGGATAAGSGTTGEALENGAAAAVEQARLAGPWSFQFFRSAPPRRQGSSSRGWLYPLGAVAAAAIAFGGYSVLHHPGSLGGRGAGYTTPLPAATQASVAATGPTTARGPAPAVPVRAVSGHGKHPARPGEYADGSFNKEIVAYYRKHGRSELGAPVDLGPGSGVHTWPVGTNTAEAQDFYGGSHERLIVFSSRLGTYEVNEVHGICKFYVLKGGMGRFGAPFNNEYRIHDGSYRQDFEGASIVWHPDTSLSIIPRGLKT